MADTTAEITRMFGKCPIRGCKISRVIDTKEVRHGGRGYVLNHWEFCGKASQRREFFGIMAGFDLVCADHTRFLRWEPLNVKPVDPDKICDGRCMHAKRSGCDCSCRGRNHGAGNVISV